MGTPTIAVPALSALVGSGHEVVAVVTQPDRPRGRGGKMAMSPVKVRAQELDLPVLQPEKVRDEAFLQKLYHLKPDVAVVIAYGKILPKAILDIPKFGCINIHASLLPRYRGAAPINWALANGEEETGLTTMQMDPGMDTGPTYLTVVTSIDGEDDAVALKERLGKLAGPLIVETLEQVAAGMKPVPQDDSRATMAPILTKEDGRIDWSRKAEEILNHTRAFVPWPGSHTTYRDQPWKVVEARLGESQPKQAAPGTILRVDGDSILVAAGEGSVRIMVLQVPGKKPMKVRDFLNGHTVEKHVVLGAGPPSDSNSENRRSVRRP